MALHLVLFIVALLNTAHSVNFSCSTSAYISVERDPCACPRNADPSNPLPNSIISYHVNNVTTTYYWNATKWQKAARPDLVCTTFGIRANPSQPKCLDLVGDVNTSICEGQQGNRTLIELVCHDDERAYIKEITPTTLIFFSAYANRSVLESSPEFSTDINQIVARLVNKSSCNATTIVEPPPLPPAQPSAPQPKPLTLPPRPSPNATSPSANATTPSVDATTLPGPSPNLTNATLPQPLPQPNVATPASKANATRPGLNASSTLNVTGLVGPAINKTASSTSDVAETAGPMINETASNTSNATETADLR